MSKPIIQSVIFNAPAKKLYDLYMNPKQHSAFTGGKVNVSSRAGSKFTAFDGLLRGTTLLTIPGQLIVQRWRGAHWKMGDLDSTLVLTFSQKGKKGQIELVHVNVPDHDHAGVTNGWKKFYWKPLRAYLRTGEKQHFEM